MRIGVDFDNTIVAYDHLFLSIAKEWNLVPQNFSGAKKNIRDRIRARKDGEMQWQRLQGFIYGKEMDKAKLFPGVADFFQACKRRGISVDIVSHKTEYAHYDADNTNLRQASWAWMEKNAFFTQEGFAIKRDKVMFHNTRDAKLSRIKQMHYDLFIDDLVEIFTDPGFPDDVKGILFDSEKSAAQSGRYEIYCHWNEISHALFGKPG